MLFRASGAGSIVVISTEQRNGKESGCGYAVQGESQISTGPSRLAS